MPSPQHQDRRQQQPQNASVVPETNRFKQGAIIEVRLSDDSAFDQNVVLEPPLEIGPSEPYPPKGIHSP